MDAQSFQTNLNDLLDSLPPWFREGLVVSGESQAFISGIVQDNRRVEPGCIFVARVGKTSDGHQYIQDALERGASVVVGEKSISGLPVPYIQVEDGRLALAYLAAAFYRFPARKLITIGVTGTDGKTTTCNLIFNILKSAGYPAGMITTVNAVIGGKVLDTGFHVTTPEAPDVQRYLAEMVLQGLTHVVLEVTSHGLDQHRVAGCEFDLAVVTNITHEHLDYHGTYEAYREAKSRLFSSLTRSAPKQPLIRPSAVLNRDDSSYGYLASMIASSSCKEGKSVDLITYGYNPGADVQAANVELNPGGMGFEAVVKGRHLAIQSGLAGEFNVPNILAAIAATVLGLQVDSKAAAAGIAATKAIPGRMELVDMGQDFTALVDFAHTPTALKRSLESARRMLEQRAQPGKIIAIFGSAGLRDREKRRMMAETSVKLADVTILTAEDPRSESLIDILDEMKQGAEKGGGVEHKSYWCIPDRREAIRFGIRMAEAGDIVMALGKGHEQSMCFGETEYPWDDRVAMKAALGELSGQDGPQMPYLPDSR